MTLRQKKGIRAAVLTLLLLLLAIGTFDSRHGYLAAQAESSDIASDGYTDLWKAEASLPVERLAAAQASPQTPPFVEIERVVEVEKVVKVEKVVEKEVEVMVEVPVEVKKVVEVVENVQEPVRAKPTPTPWEPPHNGGDDLRLVKKPDPAPEPEPKPDPGDEPDPGVEGDRNKGHGNDEDGYDEDNPGRGGFGGVGSSGGRNDHGGSRGSGGRGNSGDHGGSGGRGNSGDHGGSGGRGNSGDHGGSGGRGNSGDHGGSKGK